MVIYSKLPKRKKSETVTFNLSESHIHDKIPLSEEFGVCEEITDAKEYEKFDGVTDLPYIINILRENKRIKFFYLTHVVSKKSTEHHYFNLKVATFDQVDRSDYYTISLNGCAHISLNDEIDFMPLDRFEFEYHIFSKIRQIDTFANFRIWKAFIRWRKTIRYSKFDKARQHLENNLFIANGSLRPALLNIREMCYRIADMGFCRIEANFTYTLVDFVHSQMNQMQQMSMRLAEFRELVKEVVRSACRTALLEAGFMPDDYFLEVSEGAGQLGVSGKNNLALEYYDMDIFGEAGEKVTYTEQANKKNHCKRLTSFIKLADYMIVSNLHQMLINSIYTILTLFQQHLSRTPPKSEIESFRIDAPYNERENEPMDNPMQEAELAAKELPAASKAKGKTNAMPAIPMMPYEAEKAAEPVNVPKNPLFLLEFVAEGLNIQPQPNETLFQEAMLEICNHFKDAITKLKNLVPDTYFDAFTRPIINHQFEKKTCGPGPSLNAIVEDDTHLQFILARLRNILSESFEAANTYLHTFDEMNQFYDTNNQVEESQFTKVPIDIKFYRQELAKYHRQIEMTEMIPASKAIGMFQVETTLLKAELVPSPQKCLTMLHKVIPVVAKEEVDRLLGESQDAEYNLSINPTSTVDYVNLLNFLNQIVERIDVLEKEVDTVSSLYDLIKVFRVPTPPEDLAVYQSLYPSIDRTRNAIDKAQAERDSRIEQFVVSLDKDIAEMLKDTNELKTTLNNPMLLDINEDFDKISTELKRIKDALTRIHTKANTYIGYQKALKLEQNRFEELDDLTQELKMKQLLWDSLKEWDKMYGDWLTQDFQTMDPEEVSGITMKFAKSVQQMEKALPPNSVLPILKNKVEEMKQKLSVITYLRNPCLKDRHWEMLQSLLGLKLIGRVDEEPPWTMQNLIDQNAFDKKERIEEIAAMAGSETNLEAILKKVEDSWRTMEFVVLPFKESKDVFILGGTDEIQQLWDDSNINISTIASSRHVGPIKPRVDDWLVQLDLFGKTLEEWLNCQRSWLYLESIFSAPDIQRQLPSEAKSFMAVDKSYKEIMRKVQKVPLAMRAGTMPGLLDLMRNNNALLEQIHKCLEAYLESKRAIFPRFYFLSNDELLEILAQTRNPLAVQPHLRKCFDAIAKLQFGIANPNRDPKEEIQYNTDIHAMISPEGEVVSLGKGLKARANVEDWLGKVEEAMFGNLRKSLKNCIADYTEMNRMTLFKTHPNQVVLTVEQIYWAKEITEILERDEVHERVEGIQEYEQKCFSNLSELAAMVRGELPKLVRSLLGAMITIDVHSRDIVSEMVVAKVDSIRNFDWQRQLRYYWDLEANNCIVMMSISTYWYSYEYLGASPRLVITPLTDRCYLCLMGALQLDLGGAPAGPAGTGKTETTKDLAKSLAKQCVVFNCSDGLDYKMMGRFFSGLAQSGAWCCFDEFNRIDIEVLSVIAQQLITIKNAKSAKVARFMFEGREIKLIPTCAAFITMNPGYAGRTELPDNLKALFRPISMMVPDYRLIAEVILYSEGFESSKTLALKMTQMYKLCSEQLSQQDHYDFGMRALKSVLVMAGALKRENADTSEDVVLIRALRDSNLPKFLKRDAALFKAILQDLFPGVILPEHDYGHFKEEIESVLQKRGLQVVASQVVKVIQFYETLLVRHGVMLVGPTGGGKTVIYEVLAQVLENLHKNASDADRKPDYQPVKTYVMNPKSISMGELYGEVNKMTLEWHDGLMAYIVRLTVQDTTPTHQWVICDGPVDALWIENMNTVLDDNKMLCLANSERIKLTNYVHMLFEVQDLAVASPATVSRCGMVYVDPEELGWMPYVKTWMSGLSAKLSETVVTFIMNMFEQYMEPFLKFCMTQAASLMPQVPIARVQTTCKLIESLILPSQGKSVDLDVEPSKLNPMLGMSFAFSLLWGCAGPLIESNWDSVDYTFRQLFDECADARLPQFGDVWGAFPDLNTRKMDAWDKLMTPFVYNKNIPFFEMMVPTTDTVRYGFLLEKLLSLRQSVLFTGITGVGKTVIARDTILRIANDYNYVPAFVNFSAQTSSNRTQEIIESKLEKRRKGVLGAPKGKRIVMLVDDLNMPKLDTYFSQPPIELLRQYQGFSGFYDRDKLTWIEIEDVTLAAACGPPGGGRNAVTPRLVRFFSLFAIPTPTEHTLKHIFSLIMHGFLMDFSTTMRDMSDNIVQAAVEIYTRLAAELLPTPAKSHYVFNLRDLSKCIQGMLQADPAGVRDKQALIRLFYHEVQRVFHDRLICQEDKSFFHEILNDAAGRILGDQGEPSRFSENPILFGDFMRMGATDRIFEELPNIDKIKTVLGDYLDDYNMVQSKDVKLVFFMDAIEHITRIARIIRQDRGNALLVGVGGTGKQSMTRLAAHINGCSCMQIELCRGYDYNSFHEDLRKLYHLAGVQNKPTVFLFTDNQIVVEEFLEDINNMLNSGEVPNLFEGEELEKIIQGCRAAAKEKGISEGNRDAIYDFCIARVRNNLHIVLCMSPVGSAFRSRCRMFPSLVNCCTVDWFTEWPEEALFSVARSSLKEVQEFGDDDELKENISSLCTYIHLTVSQAADQFYQELKRHYYTTPTSYLELITVYLQMLSEKKTELVQKREKFRNGLQKIHETNSLISTMETELTAMRPQLEKKQKDTEQLMIKLAEDQEKADEVKSRVQVDETQAKAKAEETQAIAADAQRDLDEALPALEAANKALDSLDKNDIAEIRVFNKPPALVQTVLEAVCLMLGSKTDWASAKQLLGEGNFLKRLVDYPKDNISEALLKKLKRYIDNPDFEPEVVEKTSKACKSMCMWVRALDLYARVFRTVEPKRNRLKQANDELQVVMSQLKEKQKALKAVEDKIAALQEVYESSVKERKALEQNLALTSNRLKRAGKLTTALADEKDRWQVSVESYNEQIHNVIGDVFMAAACVAYYGAFTSDFRGRLVEKWREKFIELKIPVSDNVSLFSAMGDAFLLRKWNAEGLPRDSVSTDNALLVVQSKRWPLMIDPQEQANRWIRNRESQNNLKVTKLTDNGLLRTMENAIRMGCPVLLEDVGETLDPALEPILLRQTFVAGGRLLIRLGDSDVEYDKNFKLYITTKLANPHYLPEVAIKVTIINFTVTPVGLEDQLLGEVVRIERPDLEQQRTELIVRINQDKGQLQSIENKILKMLYESEGNILDNEELVNTLNESKRTSGEINKRLSEAEVTEERITTARSKYIPVSARGSVLYFVIALLADIDPMYQFSLKYFISLFNNTIEKSPESEDLDERITILLSYITKSTYNNVARGLFEQHKLIFSLMLCCSILRHRNDISDAEWSYFLMSTSLPDRGNYPTQPEGSSITRDQWRNLCNLLDFLPDLYKDLRADLVQSRMRINIGQVEMQIGDGQLNESWNARLTDFQKLILIATLESQSLVAATFQYVKTSLGPEFIEPPPIDLPLLFEDMNNVTPLVFILSTGSDPMNTFLRFARERNFQDRTKAVSLGQGQGPLAKRLIEQAQKSGDWVFLQNCHLAASWMLSLEEIVKNSAEHSQHIDPNFRLFLSSMPAKSFPVSVLQNSVKVTNEPPKGLRANLKRALNEISNEYFETHYLKTDWSKLVFGICIFHAVILERKKFGALGWNIRYEFNDSDRECALSNLQIFCFGGAGIPWDALTYITSEITYGGRVTDFWDQRCLRTILKQFFHQGMFQLEYKFSPSGIYHTLESQLLQDYRDYVELLPLQEDPELFGLSKNANLAFQIQETSKMLDTILSIQSQASGGSKEKSSDEIVHDLAGDILARLPKKLNIEEAKQEMFEEDSEGRMNSLSTVLGQEIDRFNKLLVIIRTSLVQLQKAVKGIVVMSEQLEMIYNSFLINQVPKQWANAAYPSLKSLAGWVKDLVLRLDFFHMWMMMGPPGSYWLSGFFFPQGFLTGTLQNYARKYQYPIDHLSFKFKVFTSTYVSQASISAGWQDLKFGEKLKDFERLETIEDGVIVHGLFMEGCLWEDELVQLAEPRLGEMMSVLPAMHMKPEMDWVEDANKYIAPMYKTSERAGTLSTTGMSTNFIVGVPLPTDRTNDFWISMGAALITEDAKS
ncbi:Dynein heavy chain 6, axonemal [Cichlidogyrus casuarinus]|uniref:Dynein heavy chain 6, axonemal n=1 Tax=Cichlidogyrus casuarinus TaxID=1844966 RepID=A0ABD2QJN1_9PLAT